MNLRFTDHARARMRQRRVSEADVQESFEIPDLRIVGDLGESIAVKAFGTDQVRIVYEERESDE